MEHLINNAITYWYFPAFFAFIISVYLWYLWCNRISNTYVAVEEFQKLCARFNLDLQQYNKNITLLSTAVDFTPKYPHFNFPNREVLLVMESLKALRKAARSFHRFDCKYRIIIFLAPKLFDGQFVHNQLLTAERQANEVMKSLNNKFN